MKAISTLLLLLILISVQAQETEDQVFIIPQPKQIVMGNSHFTFSGKTVIVYNNSDLYQQANLFKENIEKNLSIKITVANHVNSKSEKHEIALRILENENALGNEGYNLKIENAKITIEASALSGTYYGLQSLLQLLFTNADLSTKDITEIKIPTLEITDSPRFAYRGMHLDVGRHVFPPEFVKEYIDLLAYYKFNTFHWHLTEDQGWRIEIKKYPKLTEVGAWRKETLIGHGGNKPYEYDGKPYGGFYTQDEIRDIVQYAAKRQITIIPEIEMPGHSLAALAAYPELGCTKGPYEVATRWGVFDDIYCTSDTTFAFLEDVLLEVMELFPSKYIHIGGDEAPKARWKECATCQATIKREGLADEHELQSYFIQRMEKFLNSHGRNIIGWDEILEGGLAPNATVMSWRGTEGGIAAAQQGHDAIMTPGSHCYFDHYQSKLKTEPLAIGGYLPLEKVYSYEPVPELLNTKDTLHILGTQGNVWTEYMETPEQVEYMILPRMAALSEVNWASDKNWELFQKKIAEHFKLYEHIGYNYCNHH